MLNLFTEPLPEQFSETQLINWVIANGDSSLILETYDEILNTKRIYNYRTGQYGSPEKIHLEVSPQNLFIILLAIEYPIIDKYERNYISLVSKRIQTKIEFLQNNKLKYSIKDNLHLFSDKDISKFFPKKHATIIRRDRRELKQVTEAPSMVNDMFSYKIFEKFIGNKKLTGAEGIVYINKLAYNRAMSRGEKEVYVRYLTLINNISNSSENLRKLILEKVKYIRHNGVNKKFYPYITFLDSGIIKELNDDDSFDFELSTMGGCLNNQITIGYDENIDKLNSITTNNKLSKQISKSASLYYLQKVNNIQSKLNFKSKILNKINKYIIDNSEPAFIKQLELATKTLNQIKEQYDQYKSTNN